MSLSPTSRGDEARGRAMSPNMARYSLTRLGAGHNHNER